MSFTLSERAGWFLRLRSMFKFQQRYLAPTRLRVRRPKAELHERDEDLVSAPHALRRFVATSPSVRVPGLERVGTRISQDASPLASGHRAGALSAGASLDYRSLDRAAVQVANMRDRLHQLPDLPSSGRFRSSHPVSAVAAVARRAPGVAITTARLPNRQGADTPVGSGARSKRGLAVPGVRGVSKAPLGSRRPLAPLPHAPGDGHAMVPAPRSRVVPAETSATKAEADGSPTMSSRSTLHIDGHALGRWTIQHLERVLGRPSAGITGVDPRASAPRTRISPF